MLIIGWFSAALFAICAMPQARKSRREGHSRGIDSTFLSMWALAEILGIIYVWDLGSHPLLLNYGLNLLFLSIIIYYKVFPRKAEEVIEG